MNPVLKENPALQVKVNRPAKYYIIPVLCLLVMIVGLYFIFRRRVEKNTLQSDLQKSKIKPAEEAVIAINEVEEPREVTNV